MSGFYGSPPAGAFYRAAEDPQEMQEDQAPGSSRLPLLCASVAGFIAFVLTWRLLGLQTHALELAGGQSEVMDSVLAVVPAVAKVAAIALSLAAGWRGGDIFPLMLAGGAAGAATLALLPAWWPRSPSRRCRSIRRSRPRGTETTRVTPVGRRPGIDGVPAGHCL
ncbi:chloride channel protein [Actinomyces urogenitalis]|nr:chloride channel protein [Actinomyces urogenitalis]KGF04814.1 hypothetical protein HMPREF1626_00810 [Actinomyces urogenitalis S6-C4]MDK8835824.1 chloride channel protein [Actinomyces urogenitalis]MDU5426804.1 chloride channel protein [Actinomyces urogenitalis]MDU5875285.1 chloride channel protein [Actinomyces urogenitalis]